MRDIDRIIEAVKDHPNIPPVHKQVLISRIEVPPTRAELDAAAAIVYPERQPGFVAEIDEES